MDKILKKPFLAISLLAVLCAYLFFFKLGGMALTDPDETFYAQTAKEMLNKGDWTTPYLYGNPQFEKPIMIYWLVEASYKIFGVNETAARLPSAVFGLLGVIAIYLLGKLLFGRRAGFLSAIILATNVEYVIISRACITDMVLATFMLLGVLFFFYGYLKERGYFYILASTAFALAVLTKGPIAIVLPAVVFVIFLLFTKDAGRLKKIPLGWCLLIFILVAAPWYILTYRLHGKEFIDAFFGFHNITRFMQSEHKTGSQLYYNIPIVFGGFFPWSVFLPFGFWYIFKKSVTGNAAERSKYIFILAWFFVIFIFFSASSTKLPTYIFPSFLSLALIVGVLWDDFLSGSGRLSGAVRQLTPGVKISYYFLIAAVIAGAIGAWLFVSFDMPEILAGVVVSSLFLVFGFSIAMTAFIKKRYVAAFFFVVYSLVIFLLPVNSLILPEVEQYETSKKIAGILSSMMKTGEGLGAQGNYLPGLAFYMDKTAIDLDKHQAMLNFLNSPGRVWAVIKEKNQRNLYDPVINSEYIKPTYLIYSIGKRAIVTNSVPEGVPYLVEMKAAK